VFRCPLRRCDATATLSPGARSIVRDERCRFGSSRRCTRFAEQVLANALRDGVAFAAVVDTSAGAPTIDRLIALSGRKP